jgi:probable F420-dependent oxidoreductase
VKLGVVTPVLTRLPRAHAKWEETAGIAEITGVALEAERLGYHHLTCSEHIGIPTDVAEVRGATYWDPLATLAYLAARTSTIRLATHVLVLGYHHPLEIAKCYGTLDRISDGRLILGVGVGSLEKEFDLLGAPFDDRGERADDAIRALRAAWARREPSYAGKFYAFDGFVVEPFAANHRTPFWVGGRTARSLRRAVELADGWVPFGIARPQLGEMIARARETDAWTERAARKDAPPFELVLQNEHPFDAVAEPERVREAAFRLRDVGATMLNVRFVHQSVDHYVEQLAAMQELMG